MKNIVLIAVVIISMVSVFAKDIPWADNIMRSDPVLARGLGPENVTPGYEITALSSLGRNGEIVDRYESWTAGPSGHKVECAFRPGEAVEAKHLGTRVVNVGGKNYEVETWHAKRLVRCGNPTDIEFYRWFDIKTITKESSSATTPVKNNISINNDISINIDVPTPAQPVIQNISYNLTPQNYGSAASGGIYGPTVYYQQLFGVQTVAISPININNVNNNANANTNVNANNNAINVGSGSATGTSTGSGDSTATSK
jgi:hypothetical protein